MKRASAQLLDSPNKAPQDYVIGERIGKGAFAQVFRAIETNTARTVAIKEILLSELSSVESIMREIELLKDLTHPNIVQYLGYYKHENRFRIVLEYCESGSLAGILRKFGVFPETLLSIYMSQVLQGLAYLHNQGTIHRDIKGANILTTKEGFAKLADFGVATDTLKADGPQQVVGTPHWMAPEIIQLQEPTTACDIWSLGCTVVELATGHPPYHQLSSMATMYSMVNDDMPPIPQELSPICRDFVQLCFQKDPLLRSTAQQLLEHAWINKQTTHAVPTDAIKTIAQFNDQTRKLSVASQLDLRKGYLEAVQVPKPQAAAPLKSAQAIQHAVSVSAFVETEGDDEFDDLDVPDSWDLAKAAPAHKAQASDPFKDIAELMVEEPNQRLVGIHEETHKLVGLLSKTPDEIYYYRLCELINAEPSVKKLLLQHRIMTLTVAVASNAAVRLNEAIFDFLYLMLKSEENCCDSFCLNGGLGLLLGQFSLMPMRCLLVLREILVSYSSGSRLIVCQSKFVQFLVKFLISNDQQVSCIAVECITIIFDKFGARRRVELWYIFNQASLLTNIVEALDKAKPSGELYDLLLLFARLPPETIGEFISKHGLRKLMHVYRHLPAASDRRQQILKFYKSISTVPEALEAMDAGKLGPYFVRILQDCYKQRNAASHLRASCLLPLFHNFCRLSSKRQSTLAKVGLVPLLIATSTIEPDLKEFSLPLLCTMAHNGDECWSALWKCNGLEFLVRLINEGGWETVAMGGLVVWLTRQADNVELQQRFIELRGIEAIVRVVGKAQAPEIFTSLITSLSTLVDNASVLLRRQLPVRNLFIIFKRHLAASLAPTALVRVLMVIRGLAAEKNDLMATGLDSTVRGLLKTDLPIMCKRLAEEILR